MIPIVRQPEPTDFQDKVTKKGNRFLQNSPHPTNWGYRSYWRAALPDLWNAYRGICAYCCHWIPLEQGSASVDHFIPKHIAPDRAYDWDNFRLAASKMNSKKGTYLDVIDPFELQEASFLLVFPSMLVKPNPLLDEDMKKQVLATITRLDLNRDEALINSRLKYVLDLVDGRITFDHLVRHAPFIAYEIERQGLLDSLSKMFEKRRVT